VTPGQSGAVILGMSASLICMDNQVKMRIAAASKGSAVAMPIGKDRAFPLLLFGSSVSLLGSRVTTIAYPMLVLYLTGSPLYAGWVAFAVTAPSVVIYAPAGVLVDRWDPRRVLLLSEFGRGAVVATVVITLWLGRPSVLLLVATATFEGILEAFSTLSERCYVRSIVDRDQALPALARMEARTHVVVLFGRPLGGFLFGLRPILPFVADALSFIVSVSAIFSIKKEHSTWQVIASGYRDLRTNVHSRWISEMQFRNGVRDAVHWLRREPPAWLTLAIAAYATLIFQALIMIFLADAHARGLRPITIGEVLATSGVGGAVGSLTTAVRRKRANSSKENIFWIKFQTWSWAVAFGILAIFGGQSLLMLAATMSVLGCTGALGNIELNTYLIRVVDGGMLARVTSIGRAMTFGACAVGWAIGGILAQASRGHAIAILFAMTMALPVLSAITPRPPGPNRPSMPNDSIQDSPIPLS
jgi:MFS family permease